MEYKEMICLPMIVYVEHMIGMEGWAKKHNDLDMIRHIKYMKDFIKLHDEREAKEREAKEREAKEREAKEREGKMEGKVLFWFIMGNCFAFLTGFIIGKTL